MDDNKNNPVWQLGSTNPEHVEPLKDRLREVIDPEIGLNIIELGLVRDVQFTDTGAMLTMILTTPFCPYGPAMLEATRMVAEEYFGKPTMIDMGPEMWDLSYMEEGAGAEWGLF